MNVVIVNSKDWKKLNDNINLIWGTVQAIATNINKLVSQGVTIMADLTALTNEVTENVNVEQSAIQLIQNIAAQLQAAGTDQTALNTLQQKLATSAQALAAAITANTPAA